MAALCSSVRINKCVLEKGFPCDNIAQCLSEKGYCFKMKTHLIVVSGEDMLAYGPNANNCVWQSRNAETRNSFYFGTSCETGNLFSFLLQYQSL